MRLGEFLAAFELSDQLLGGWREHGKRTSNIGRGDCDCYLSDLSGRDSLTRLPPPS